jgi:hypothetical protein
MGVLSSLNDPSSIHDMYHYIHVLKTCDWPFKPFPELHSQTVVSKLPTLPSPEMGGSNTDQNLIIPVFLVATSAT